jgi:hypothetical protein
MTEAELALAFKDQRELSWTELTAFAELLGVSPAEAACARAFARRLRPPMRGTSASPRWRRGWPTLRRGWRAWKARSRSS